VGQSSGRVKNPDTNLRVSGVPPEAGQVSGVRKKTRTLKPLLPAKPSNSDPRRAGSWTGLEDQVPYCE